jgi:hypothetical protein
MMLWNIWAVVGMLITFAVLGVQLGKASVWILDLLQQGLGMIPA